MRKLAVSLGVAALLTLGAFGQTFVDRVAGAFDRETRALLWINALELTTAQMKELLKLADELMPLRDEILAMPDKLHEDLVRFTGKPRELRDLLSNYQKDLREKLQTLEDKFTAGLKKILTVEQWDRLTRGILSEGKAAPQTFFGWRKAPRALPTLRPWREAPRALPTLRPDLGRGLTLVRFLPALRDALAAKIEALEK